MGVKSLVHKKRRLHQRQGPGTDCLPLASARTQRETLLHREGKAIVEQGLGTFPLEDTCKVPGN